MDTRLLSALGCSNTSGPPVWMMRQAGRYLPEYREIRKNYSFTEMYKQPEIAAKITLQPIKRFGMDAAILFSDILVIPEALGLGLEFIEKVGPVFERPLNTASDINALPSIDVKHSLSYVQQAIQRLLPELSVPLIGFAGAPFTLASYMIEGKSSPDFKKTKKWMLSDPKSFHRLLNHLTACTIDYLNLQIESGVHALQIFDSWVSLLSYSQFREFSLPYLKEIRMNLKNPDIPVILFCRGSSVFLKDLTEAMPQAISLDWNIDLKRARNILPKTFAIQGNLDPDVLYAPLPVVKQQTKALLDAMKEDTGYIFNLGHGVKPDVDIDAVKMVVDTVKSYR